MQIKYGLLLLMILIGCVTPRSVLAEDKKWHDTIAFSGDLRYRFENIQEENIADRDRQSLRVRFGFEASPTDNWKAIIRLASGATNPISSEQTLGEYFTRKPIGLDLAYMEFKGFPVKASLAGGKMENPFIIVGKSQLIWDVDLAPEGIGGKFEQELMKDINIFVRGGGFWVQEKAAALDPMICGAQTGVATKIQDIQVIAGFGYIYFTDITNQYAYDYAASNTATAKGYGNTLGNGRYINNYMLVEGFADISFKLFDIPVEVYTDYVLNNGAVRSNKGYLLGLNVNKAKEPGSWEGGYNFRWVEKDAAVGAFNDSSFIGGGTNGSGHNLYAAYAITNKVKACLTYFICQKNLDDPKYYRRLQVDVNMAY